MHVVVIRMPTRFGSASVMGVCSVARSRYTEVSGQSERGRPSHAVRLPGQSSGRTAREHVCRDVPTVSMSGELLT